jgi:hypothetical protein
MPKASLFVYSRPSAPDREDEYNKWYDNTHIPEMCQIPGVVSGRRYKTSAVQMAGVGPDPSTHEYVAIYELDSDDLKGVFDELGSRGRSGVLQMSDALQLNPPPRMVLYELHNG